MEFCMSNLYHIIEGDGAKYENLPLTMGEPLLAVSETGNLICFPSVVFDGDRDILSIDSMPNFQPGMNVSKLLSKKSFKYFLQLRHGCFFLTKPTQAFEIGCKYKPISARFLYTGHDEPYKIILSQNQDSEVERYLSRELFGLSSDELITLLSRLEKTLYQDNNEFDYDQFPRLSRSRKSNFCEHSGIWIPKYFPYISFAPSGELHSHIALYTFYQFLKLLLVSDRAKDEIAQDCILNNTLSSLNSINPVKNMGYLLTQPYFYGSGF